MDQLIEPERHKLLGKADKLTEDREDPFQLLGRHERTRSDTPKVCWILQTAKYNPGTRKMLAQSLETVPKHKSWERFQLPRNASHRPKQTSWTN